MTPEALLVAGATCSVGEIDLQCRKICLLHIFYGDPQKTTEQSFTTCFSWFSECNLLGGCQKKSEYPDLLDLSSMISWGGCRNPRQQWTVSTGCGVAATHWLWYDWMGRAYSTRKTYRPKLLKSFGGCHPLNQRTWLDLIFQTLLCGIHRGIRRQVTHMAYGLNDPSCSSW